MAKLNITIGKGTGMVNATTAKTLQKEDVYQCIIEALNARYGEDSARMLIVMGNSDCPADMRARGEYPAKIPAKIEIGVKCANITEDGCVYDGIQTIKVTSKDWEDRTGATTTKESFDWDYATGAYDEYARREAEKRAAKEADKARREAELAAKKAAREAEKARKAAEKEAAKTANEIPAPTAETETTD